MKRKIFIEEVENGFILREGDHKPHEGYATDQKIHVFEKAEALAKWIELNLRPGGKDRGAK